jgi:branched-chain amino acid transport system substrate-binding protein
LRAASDALLVALGVLACTPTRFDQSPCQSNVQCRDAFGLGAYCGPAGLCEAVPLIARCDRTYPDDLYSHFDRYHDAVVVGTVMDRSSPAHVVRERAVRLAIKEADEAGGLDGRRVALVSCDAEANSDLDDYDRTQASVITARYLAHTFGATALVGPCASADVEQVWQALRPTGAVIASPSATSPLLAQLEPESSDARPGILWRLAPSDAIQGRLIADDLLKRAVRRAAVVREPGPYGEGLADVFSERFTGAGGQVRITAVNSDGQLAPAAASVAASDLPEVLFISSQQDWVVKFLIAAGAQSGFQAKNIFLTDAAANQAVLDRAAPASWLFPRIRGTRPAPRDLNDYVYASFAADYRAEYAEDPTVTAFSAHAYDAAWLVLYGSAWSLLQEHRLTALATARGLRQLSAGEHMPVIPASWPAVVTAFREGRSIDVSGASGELDFDPVTREVAAPLEVWTIAGTPPRIGRAPAGPPDSAPQN